MRYKKGHKYKGVAIDIKQYGAVLKMEDGSTQLLHISNMSEGFVANIADIITIGETYEVTAIPGTVKSLEFTLKDVDVSEFYEDDSADDDIDFGELLERYLPKPDHRDRKFHRKYNKEKE